MTSTTLPVFVLDERRVVIVFNRGCEELTGWAASDVIGKVCDFAIDGEPGLVHSLTGLLAPPPQVYSGEAIVSPLPLTTKSGTTLDCVIRYFPLGKVAGDERYRVLGIISPGKASVVESDSAVSGWHSRLARHVAEVRRRYGVPLIATSAAMQRVAAQIKLAQETNVAVHLQGPPGSGKEWFARRIHYAGRNAERVIVPVDCRLAHDELSRVLERGLSISEIASNCPAALVLKHVEYLPRDLQASLEERMATGIEGPRLYSTSESCLALSVQRGAFSSTLLSLLTTLTIELPALQSRAEDIPLLAQQILETCNQRQAKQIVGFDPQVCELFRLYHFPGNIAELESIVHTAWQRCSDITIALAHLPFQFMANEQADDVPPAPQFPSLEQHVQEAERSLLAQAMLAAKGNKTLVAEWLKVPRAKLYRRLEALQLETAASAVDESDGEII